MKQPLAHLSKYVSGKNECVSLVWSMWSLLHEVSFLSFHFYLHSFPQDAYGHLLFSLLPPLLPSPTPSQLVVRGSDPGESHSVLWSTARLHLSMEDSSLTSFVLDRPQYQTYPPPNRLHPPTQGIHLSPQHQYLPPLYKQNRLSRYHFNLRVDLPIVHRMGVCLMCWILGGVALAVLGTSRSCEVCYVG